MMRAGVACARNVRVGVDGEGVECMREPKLAGVLTEEPAFVEEREGRTHLFTVGRYGALTHKCEITVAGELSMTGEKELGYISAGECQVATSGPFLLVRDGAGKVHRLRWRGDKYELMSSLPEFGGVRVKADVLRPFTSVISAQRFKTPVKDLRSEIPESVESQMLRAVKEGVGELRRMVHEAGCYAEPVMVRVAARLWDGSLLQLGAPQYLAPVDYVQQRQVSLSVSTAEEGITGTSAHQISMLGYKVDVQADWMGASGWDDVVKCLEIWISPVVDPEELQRTGKVGYNSQRMQLNVEYACRSEEEMQQEQLGALPELAWSGGPGRIETVIGYSRGREQRSVWLDERVRNLSGARVISGHGGFLYLWGVKEESHLEAEVYGEPESTQSARCRVSVKLHKNGVAQVKRWSNTIRCDNGRISPFLWLADSTAREMRVQLEYADGRKYEGNFELRSSVSGENAALWVNGSRDLVQLEAVGSFSSDWEETSSEAAQENVLYVSKRGNPLVMQSRLPVEEVNDIVAQISGGGAYTRQYLYLLTASGVMAVTHDMEGNIVNARPIAPESVTRGGMAVASMDGVFVLADNGMLLRLCDSRVKRELMGLRDVKSMGICRSMEEVWLSGERESEVLGFGSVPGRMSRVESTERFAKMVTSGDELLGARKNGEIWHLKLIGEPEREELLSGVWVSEAVELQDGGISEVFAELSGRCEEVGIEVRMLSPWPSEEELGKDAEAQGEVVAEVKVSGVSDHEICVPVVFPSGRVMWGCNYVRFRIVIKGKFDGLRKVGYRQIDY